ncbi:hypothetical protein AB0N28_16350 [Streptomyces sp. NPDC051130]|uniref:hypothetical protein n=1 Tax=Streptomyces sp. NPDC051130 TaxID=3157223 RepID=UPI0034341F56
MSTTYETVERNFGPAKLRLTPSPKGAHVELSLMGVLINRVTLAPGEKSNLKGSVGGFQVHVTAALSGNEPWIVTVDGEHAEPIAGAGKIGPLKIPLDGGAQS